jgi:hypothetical protein
MRPCTHITRDATAKVMSGTPIVMATPVNPYTHVAELSGNDKLPADEQLGLQTYPSHQETEQKVPQADARSNSLLVHHLQDQQSSLYSLPGKHLLRSQMGPSQFPWSKV